MRLNCEHQGNNKNKQKRRQTGKQNQNHYLLQIFHEFNEVAKIIRFKKKGLDKRHPIHTKAMIVILEAHRGQNRARSFFIGRKCRARDLSFFGCLPNTNTCKNILEVQLICVYVAFIKNALHESLIASQNIKYQTSCPRAILTHLQYLSLCLAKRTKSSHAIKPAPPTK